MQAPTQPADDTPLLAVRDLRTHIFTRRGVVKAVNGVSFQLRAGETLGLVGESGSGKTMTCLSILRLLPRGARIVSGEIVLQGSDLVTASEAALERLRGKQMGMVLQNALAALDPVFTIGTQVGEPLVIHQRLSWRAALRRVVELLRLVKVVAPEMRLHSYPHELSGGMRQRVASAAAIGCAPALLIADEPTTALDVTTQRQYLDLLKELQQATGMAIIFVTHDISLVGNMCDQLAVFYGGLLVEYGPRQQILSQPSHPYTMALLQAIPQLGESRERLASIAGEPPDLGRLPAGCPFHPRCEAALDVCRTGAPPPVFPLAQGRQVRCWLREQEHDRSAVGSA
ncbi:MAG: ABC transporter ATP-binding protein [Candidatus Tectomicrobia bacterium]|uniref:ABC transporter ATP-binding protein n=1 Tax=Tectimicrobiota bacterium TaxID=2528274 RepID=A0A938AZZ3_UNCTE|nr:ABC transporter ATP-binding protein [Candidatus Tectomicrobia bacterium]